MQAPNAQGIMGLMSQGRAPQGAPQQPPMPSPMKASPMAGLGSVEDRVAAYRGNPAPLQQRYQMSQDLLDLLALQKIKSEKDAAARQMQLQMGQQQAAQGMEPQTVAQQREKEVMELTKNELAQQRGETAQHQQEQQQAAMQKMMGGIASAPGAAAAAQPKAMATGGIVAFPDGGAVNDKAGNPLDTARERRRIAQEALYRFGLRQRQQDPEAFRAAQEELRAADDAVRAAEFAESGGPAGVMRRPMGAGPVAPAAPATPAGPAVSDTYPDESRRGAAAGLTAPTGAAPQVPPPAAPTVRPPTAMPGAGPAAPAAAPAQGAPADGLASLVDKTATNMMNIDPEAKQRAMEDRIRAAYALTPEQKAVYDQGIAQRQKMFEETYDPEKQRQQGIIKYLLGAGGRRYGEFAGGAEAGMSYDEAQRQAKIKDFDALQKSREGLVGLEREGIKPSIEGGLAALKEYATGQRGGLEAGYKRVEGALDRDSRERIARDSNRIQGMIAQATRDQTLEIRRQGFMQDINKTETRALGDIQKGPIAKAAAGLEQIKAMNPKGFTKEQQQQLDDLNRQLQDAEQVIRAQMDVYREQLGGFTGAGKGKSGSGQWGELNVVPGKK